MMDHEHGLSKSAVGYKLIRELILGYEVAPGQKISIRHLSDRLGIGLTPLREALIRLEHDGYITISKRDSYRVKSITSHYIFELFDYGQALIEHVFRDYCMNNALQHKLYLDSMISSSEFDMSHFYGFVSGLSRNSFITNHINLFSYKSQYIRRSIKSCDVELFIILYKKNSHVVVENKDINEIIVDIFKSYKEVLLNKKAFSQRISKSVALYCLEKTENDFE